MVEPTGVEKRIDAIIPRAAQRTDVTAEQTITLLKLLKRRIAERAGKMISADMSSEPTRFIATTMMREVITATSRL